MGFIEGAKITANILGDIVNGLIASGVWHNVDTTWNTIDKTINNARYVLAYGAAGATGKGNTTISADLISGTRILSVVSEANFSINDKVVIGSGLTAEVRIVTAASPGSITVDSNVNTLHITGQTVKELDFEIYMAMEIINQSSGMTYYQTPSYPYPWHYGKGIRIVFSASWDALAHTYPVSNQSTFVPFETCYNCGVSADLATILVTYWLWIEDAPATKGNGFVIMGKPEPTGDSHQQSFILVIERNPSKEYADGYSNFFLYTACNIYAGLYDGDATSSIWRNRQVLRPFAYQYYDGGGRLTTNANGAGISFVPMPSYYAFKSNGNNKVYYVKPLVHNHAGQYSPIFQSELFFLWSEGVGLIDGDVVSIEGTTIKYLCKALDSPDSTSRLTYGIKYDQR